MKNLYIILFILPLIGFGQGWEQSYGISPYNYGRSIQQTTDGGYIVCGGTGTDQTMLGSSDLYVIKIDENGNEEWFQNYGYSMGRSIQQTTDGGYIIGGSEGGSGGGSGGVVIKVDQSGNIEWEQTYSTHICSIIQHDDEGYVLGGENQIIKIDNQGEVEMNWSPDYSEGDSVWIDNIIQTNDGNYLFIGWMWFNLDFGENSYGQVYFGEISEVGEEQWSTLYGPDGTSNHGYSVVQNNNEEYLFLMYIQEIVPEVSQEIITVILKTNDNGEEQWTQSYEGIIGGDGINSHPTVLTGKELIQIDDGGYVFCGTEWRGYEDYHDIVLFKIDEDGNEEWRQYYGETSNDRGHSVQQTVDGGYIICGTKGTSEYLYIIKTDSQGNVTSTIELPRPTSKRELIKTTNILGQENTTIKNQPMIEIYDDGSTEKKIVLE